MPSALGASMLFATASTHAHSHPTTPKGLAPAHTYKVMDLDSVAALSSPTTRPNFYSSPHVLSGGFHSTPSYHLYSTTPSRSFTFRSSSPSISIRPANTSAPRTYNYSSARSTSSMHNATSVEVHHYHNSGGGGVRAMDYLVLNQVMNGHNRSSNDGSTGTARFASSEREVVGPVDSSEAPGSL